MTEGDLGSVRYQILLPGTARWDGTMLGIETDFPIGLFKFKQGRTYIASVLWSMRRSLRELAVIDPAKFQYGWMHPAE